MKKRTKLLWKFYLKQTLLTATMFTAFTVGGIKIIDAYRDSDKKEPDKKTSDYLPKMIEHLFPVKFTELKELYTQTYAETVPGAVLGRHDSHSQKNEIFEDLKDIENQVKWRNRGDVAIMNDTIYVTDKDTSAIATTYGFAYSNFPQINIRYLKYDGEIKKLKEFIKSRNSYSFRTKSVYHELRHIDNFRYIIHVPQNQRTRAVFAADELFATVAGNLGDYADLAPRSKKWNKSYRARANVWDVNYKLPKNSQPIIDSVITASLDKLENNGAYRKTFIENEGLGYYPTLEERAGDQKKTESDAIKNMKSAFKINGKLTDIFSLASEKVRKRAEEFIKTNDNDMRLVIYAHENKIKF